MKYTKEYIIELMEIIELIFSLNTRILATQLVSKFFNKYEFQKTNMSDIFCLFEHDDNNLEYLSIYIDRHMWDTITVDNSSGQFSFHFHNPFRTKIESDIEMLKMAYNYLKKYHNEL